MNQERVYDVVVIGSGAGGGTAVQVLTKLASISTPNNSVNTNGVFGGEDTAQANWMISFLSPNQGIGMG